MPAEAWKSLNAREAGVFEQVVDLRFFGGYTTKEIADMLGIARRTVQLDWEKARTYLYQDLRRDTQS